MSVPPIPHMKIYVHGNKWVLRAVGAVLSQGTLAAVAVYFTSARTVLHFVGTTLAWAGVVALVVLGVGIIGSTFGKE